MDRMVRSDIGRWIGPFQPKVRENEPKSGLVWTGWSGRARTDVPIDSVVFPRKLLLLARSKNDSKHNQILSK